MEEIRNLDPENIYSGDQEYSDEDFINDIIKINRPFYSDDNLEVSLNILINRILEDMKVNDEPESILKQFYDLNYHRFADDENCNVTILNEKYFLTAQFTQLIFLMYASKLTTRFDRKEIKLSKYFNLKEKHLESYQELMKGVGLQSALISKSRAF